MQKKIIWLLVFLLAVSLVSATYCVGPIVDGDSDSYSCTYDCDDSNADINPGKAEVTYNGIDDDCDPTTLDYDDVDDDLIDDLMDNCPNMANQDQLDSDGDEIGDVCDLYPQDRDNDGFNDLVDNCMLIPNSNQMDIDMDGVGDLCDNCIRDYNPTQSDSDNDGKGDECEENTNFFVEYFWFILIGLVGISIFIFLIVLIVKSVRGKKICKFIKGRKVCRRIK